MRKAILSVVVALTLSSVVAALPTSAGGTLYMGFITGDSQIIKYYDLGTDWLPTASGTLATVPDYDTSAGTFTYGSGYGINSGSSLDATLGGVLHSADILVGGAITEDFEPDLVSVGTSGTPVVLNNGDPELTGLRWAIAVDSGFTPNGEASGIASQGSDGNRGVWTSSDAGATYTVLTDPGADMWASAEASSFADRPAYSAIDSSRGYTVGGNLVTGLVATTRQSTAGWSLTYKKATGGYVKIQSGNSINQTSGYGNGNYEEVNLLLGDTDNDGKLDAYWMSNTGGTLHFAHAEDANGDGDWVDSGEAANSGLNLGSVWSLYGADLVQGTDGQWAIIVMVKGWDINIYPLLANGNYDVAQGVTNIVAAGTAPNDGSAMPGLVFVPLGSGGEPPIVPEPATLMLVGTGVLGLAGIIRRRLI